MFNCYSYARTSRIVKRAAFRAGKTLAIAERIRTNPSQIRNPIGLRINWLGELKIARLMMRESRKVMGKEKMAPKNQLIRIARLSEAVSKVASPAWVSLT